MQYLSFEKPIAELIEKIHSLRSMISMEKNDISLCDDIDSLEDKKNKLTTSIFSQLTAWETVQVARHPDRPHTEDYISRVFTDFIELCGDRNYKNDIAIVGGLARIDGNPVIIIGHRKGRDIESRVACNFGMPRPEGYRKAKRLMELAERMQLPVITFVDTPGAYPGIGAEERGQSEAIATNLSVMSRIKTPIISIVIGEGGSGGALAISVADRLMMLQHSVYSVISPEGCASILWKSADKAESAAEILKLTSKDLLSFNIIDRIIEEPLGSACRDYDSVANNVKASILEELDKLNTLSADDLVANRYNRLKKQTAMEFAENN